jgi:hypothetical protein
MLAMPPSSLSRDLNFQRASSIQPAPFFGLSIATFILLDDDEAVVLSPQTNPQSCSKQCFDHHAVSSALTSLVH